MIPRGDETPPRHIPQVSPTNGIGSPNGSQSLTNSNRINNVGSTNSNSLMHFYTNPNVSVSPQNTPSPSSVHNHHRFIPPAVPPAQLPNDRIQPPKVTQGKSIFAKNGENMVYGDPKDFISSSIKYSAAMPHSSHASRNSRFVFLFLFF